MNRLYIFCVLVACAACGKSSEPGQSRNSQQLGIAIEMAVHQMDSGNITEAESLVNQTFRKIDASPEDSLRWLSFSYNLCLGQGKFEDAIHLADSVIKRLKDKISDPKLRRAYTDALFGKGDALYALGVYPAGLRAFYEAQQVGIRYKDDCVMSDFSYRLGNINFKQERYQEAATNFYKSLQHVQDCQTPSFTSAAYHQLLLNNLALSLTRTGLEDSALGIFHIAKAQVAAYATQYSNRQNFWITAHQIINGNEAEALMVKEDYQLAEALLREALSNEVYLQLEPFDAMLSQLKLAEIYLITGRTGLADTLLAAIRTTPLLETHYRAAFKWHVLWGSLQEKQGHYMTAAQSLQTALHYRDQFLKERKNYMLLNLDENIKLMNQADRNSALAAKVERNNLLLVIILLAMLLVLFAALFFYMNFRRSNKYVGLLKILNERIKNQKSQLEKTLEELQQSYREKDRIMQMVAHDLRSPVASIYWLANAMLEEKENLTEEQQSNLELILLASSNSLTLTKDMLEAVSLLHTSEINRTERDLLPLLAQQVQLQRSNLEAKALQLDLATPEAPVKASVDAEKFSQVINNLLTNAIKFSNEGNVIEVSLSADNQSVQLTVRDHGLGLPPGQEEKIFEAFSEARRNGTHGEKSYGLGLSISRRIVSLHGGVITAGNHPEGGAIFIVTIPRVPVIDIR